MKTIVAKFGGSSLSDAEQFKKVKQIILEDKARRYIVVSAPGKRHRGDSKVTDILYMCQQLASHHMRFDEIFDLVRARYTSIVEELALSLDIDSILQEVYTAIADGASRAFCASRGEYMNALLLADYLGFPFVDAKELIHFERADRLQDERTRMAITEKLRPLDCAVIPGFYGSGATEPILCFSRGGSDVTGAILADALHADLYENWTDVSGFLAADPSIVPEAVPMEQITFTELRELSYMGASVMHEEAIFPLRRFGIPVRIRNTDEPNAFGTLITPDDTAADRTGLITGLAGKKDFSVFTINKLRMAEDASFFRKLLSVFESNDVPVAHMPSAIDSISIIAEDRYINGKAKRIAEEIRIYCAPDSVEITHGLAMIAVVGRGMIHTKGISARIFTALADNDINIRVITQGSSEINIIIGVENKDFEPAIAAIYYAFDERMRI